MGACKLARDLGVFLIVVVGTHSAAGTAASSVGDGRALRQAHELARLLQIACVAVLAGFGEPYPHGAQVLLGCKALLD